MKKEKSIFFRIVILLFEIVLIISVIEILKYLIYDNPMDGSTIKGLLIDSLKWILTGAALNVLFIERGVRFSFDWKYLAAFVLFVGLAAMAFYGPSICIKNGINYLKILPSEHVYFIQEYLIYVLLTISGVLLPGAFLKKRV